MVNLPLFVTKIEFKSLELADTNPFSFESLLSFTTIFPISSSAFASILTEFPICDDVLFESANAPTIIITTAIAAIKSFLFIRVITRMLYLKILMAFKQCLLYFLNFSMFFDVTSHINNQFILILNHLSQI